ncbi:hypothetical protein [Streptomyces sp. HPF1205]|uniref:hypothetical protein n=1 Tax=Streptomyces sp. HPF1205 TaxID=2873262 RepID=UPI001CECCCA4|nr:hypothetical protein [Streptomyces sp. HPF1205]
MSFIRTRSAFPWRATAAAAAALAGITAGVYLSDAATVHHGRTRSVGHVAPVADAAQAVNPDWSAFETLISGTARTSSDDAASPVLSTGHRTSDDGIVVLRVFIPAHSAAGGLLNGDDRGFSDSPSASYRAEFAWDVSTGQARLVVSHSSLSVGNVHIAALPLTVAPQNAWNQALAVRDRSRTDNRIGIDPNTPTGRLHVALSLLNPLTNRWGDFGAWTVDQEATVTRTAPGTYQLALHQSNGYPAIEAYYYPHYANGPTSQVIAKRSVEPAFLGGHVDSGGGAAALDGNSLVDCADNARGDFQCQNTAPRTSTINPEGSGEVTISSPNPEAPWTTSDQQDNAM